MELRSFASIALVCVAITGGFAACSGESDTSGSGGSGEGGSGNEGPGPSSSTGGPASVGSTGSGTAGAGQGGAGQGGAGQGGAGQGGAGQGGAGQGGAGQGGAGQGGGNACAHDVCVEGEALDANCSACVAALCNDDGFCCDPVDGAWDDMCVGEVPAACGIDCGGTGGGGGAGGGGTGGGGGGGNQIQEGDLVITEIMNNPAFVNDTSGEWFEVHNTTGADIDMLGLAIRHNPDPTVVPHTIASSVVVPAGGYAVLGTNADTATNGGVTVDYEYSTVTLGNSNVDMLGIQTADALPLVIDETSWDPTAFPYTGASRNLDPNFLTSFDNDDDTNFCQATTPISATNTDTGTPGVANDPCN